MFLRSLLILSALLFAHEGFSFDVGHSYKLISRHSGKCLDLREHGKDNGTRLQQWDCTGEPHQTFRVESSGMGQVKLVGKDSGRCVEVAGWGMDNGSPVQQWDCSGGGNQSMQAVPSTDGTFQMRFAHSGKCLDVSGPSFEGGALVHQWDCVGQANQDWKFVEVDAPVATPTYTTGAIYRLVSRHSGKCLDLKDHGTGDGTRLQQWDCTGEAQQAFRLIQNGNGTYSLRGKDSNRCVEVAGGGRDNGNAVQQWECLGNDHQQFRFVGSADGTSTLRFAHSGKCLDVSGPSFDNGALVHQWDCVGQANQDWRLDNVGGGSDDPSAHNRVMIDNSDEETATIKIFGPHNPESVAVLWFVYSNGSQIASLSAETLTIDLASLSAYSGLQLGATVVVNGKALETENRVEIGEVVMGPMHSQTIEAKKEGLGLLGIPIVRRLNFTFETFHYGCKSKTTISLKYGYVKETECDYRERPKDFTAEELTVLKGAAITAFKSLMALNNDSDFIVTQCAIKNANMSHGAFVRPKGVTEPAYTAQNAAKVLDTQLGKWDIFGGPIQDFNIHFRVKYSSKSDAVIGHANYGRVLSNFEHDKFQNTSRNRFEIHMARNWLPPSLTTNGTATWHDNDGNVQTSQTSLSYSAATIAHEMAHQIGLTHTTDADGNDHQDDFVYALGRCVRNNWVANWDWNDTVAF